MRLLKEFRPALLFLGKFLVIYFIANVLYGIFVEHYGKRVDPLTNLVTGQTASFLRLVGFDVVAEKNENAPTVFIKSNHQVIISVYEGCNGLNVAIVFIAFMAAFGGPLKTMTWFLPAGLLIIHSFNLLRISLLYITALHSQEYFYYFHKYFFTAILYLVVFALWTLWVTKFYNKKPYAPGRQVEPK
jgi:exosortase family protein XrtF